MGSSPISGLLIYREALDVQGFLFSYSIALLKSSAVLLNVGRGTAIDTDALTEALSLHRIAGAALDVTDLEPLPTDHLLWDCPNAIITPHVSGGFSLPETLGQIVDLFAVNLKHYFSGEPLENIQVRHRRTCREARAPKELSYARLCDPPKAQLSAGDCHPLLKVVDLNTGYKN